MRPSITKATSSGVGPPASAGRGLSTPAAGLNASASLRYEPFVPSPEKPWNFKRAAHLLRRTGLKPEADRINSMLEMTPAEAVDQIVDEAIAEPLPAPPPWRNDTLRDGASEEEKQEFIRQERFNRRFYQAEWLELLYRGSFRERMAFFWQNHFVTEMEVYRRATYVYRYVDCLRRNALGNFRDFVHEIGRTPAMLVYLDGAINTKGYPNENYARELLELFTTGLDNYTEQDIKEIARALTGWRVSPIDSRFNRDRHDPGIKTIFGRTGNFGYDDVIELIFKERRDEIARFISEKLYRLFVYVEIDEEVVDQMATEFAASDFELAVPVRSILKSNAFFDDDVIGAQMKSPVDFVVSAIRDLGIATDTWNIRGFDIFWFGRIMVSELGQTVLDPPNVAGWPGHHDWISSSSLTSRWNIVADYVRYTVPEKVLERVSDPANPFKVAFELSQAVLGYPPDEEQREELTEILLDGVPHYEWNPNTAGGRARVAQFLQHLMQLPEYQLT